MMGNTTTIATAEPNRFPPGPAPVTRSPVALLTYMRRMRGGAIDAVGERFERYGDIYYAQFLGRHVYVLRHPEHHREVLAGEHEAPIPIRRRLAELGVSSEEWPS